MGQSPASFISPLKHHYPTRQERHFEDGYIAARKNQDSAIANTPTPEIPPLSIGA
jgi:hypothetical protein